MTNFRIFFLCFILVGCVTTHVPTLEEILKACKEKGVSEQDCKLMYYTESK